MRAVLPLAFVTAAAAECPASVCRFGSDCQIPCRPQPREPSGDCPQASCDRATCGWSMEPAAHTEACRAAIRELWATAAPVLPTQPPPSAAPSAAGTRAGTRVELSSKPPLAAPTRSPTLEPVAGPVPIGEAPTRDDGPALRIDYAPGPAGGPSAGALVGMSCSFAFLILVVIGAASAVAARKRRRVRVTMQPGSGGGDGGGDDGAASEGKAAGEGGGPEGLSVAALHFEMDELDTRQGSGVTLVQDFTNVRDVVISVGPRAGSCSPRASSSSDQGTPEQRSSGCSPEAERP